MNCRICEKADSGLLCVDCWLTESSRFITGSSAHAAVNRKLLVRRLIEAFPDGKIVVTIGDKTYAASDTETVPDVMVVDVRQVNDAVKELRNEFNDLKILFESYFDDARAADANLEEQLDSLDNRLNALE